VTGWMVVLEGPCMRLRAFRFALSRKMPKARGPARIALLPNLAGKQRVMRLIMVLLQNVALRNVNVTYLKLLRLETNTFSDATLSDINVVLCHVLSQYPHYILL
jgi:hypothetical protein